MEKKIMLLAAVFLLLEVSNAAAAWAENTASDDNVRLKQEVMDLKSKINGIEKRLVQNTQSAPGPIPSFLSGIGISGGISGGPFYAKNPEPGTSDNEFLLSNFLVELSSTCENAPVGFAAAFGETSTPSILDIPETNPNFDIKYGSLTFKPSANLSLEAGLLQPIAGYECTYTYDNKNIMSGALASQQPYNAYGAWLGYDVSDMNVYAGYYKTRLDNEEYAENESPLDDSWEIGLGGEVSDMKFNIYHYHLAGMRNLTGALADYTIGNVDVGVNADYWNWESNQKTDVNRKYSMGGAVYVCPHFDKFSIPVRLEYIDQGESRIYIDSMDAKRIYTATISPTYHFCEKTYARVESAYVNAVGAFVNKDGEPKNHQVCLAAEIGYIF